MFSYLSPLDVKNSIVYSIQPGITTYKEVKECQRTVTSLWLTSKKLGEELKPACQKQMANLRNIKVWIDQQVQLLQKKYCVYNKNYQNAEPIERAIWLKRDTTVKVTVSFPGSPHPFLIDALNSGTKLPVVQKTFTEYSIDIEKDIKKILQFCPESVNSTVGHLRCRYYVPPLAMACWNEKIPVEIIELLLKNGANPNAIYSNNGGTSLLEDLKESFPERYQQVSQLLLKYGANPV